MAKGCVEGRRDGDERQTEVVEPAAKASSS
jgi:hypothetical protein